MEYGNFDAVTDPAEAWHLPWRGEPASVSRSGYYYDTETGLYYLQSRYYNPEWGRFISKDEQSYHDGESGAAANLYAYADNNPVMKSDPSGQSVWVREDVLALTIDVGIILITGGMNIRATPHRRKVVR